MPVTVCRALCAADRADTSLLWRIHGGNTISCLLGPRFGWAAGIGFQGALGAF